MKYFFIEGEIECLTGLHIGTGEGTIEIGGIDSPIVKNPLTNLPYLPGSSLKGKMRSLLEKVKGLDFNREREGIKRHECDDYDQAKECEVCRLFGSTGKTSKENNYPARLIVRDGGLTDEDSIRREGMIITEAKMENTIDRVTAAAMPRTIERVPAGIRFNLSLVYRVDEDPSHFNKDLQNILLCLKLVEKDGLGGHISRGYGQVKLHIRRFQLENEPNWLKREGKEYPIEQCEQKVAVILQTESKPKE